MKIFQLVVFCFLGLAGAMAQDEVKVSDEISLLFIGDIMGHDSQIASAKDDSTGIFDYESVFHHLEGIIADADYTIANLEVTLAGPPFKGYPQFSSPDELAVAAQNAGVDAFVTANNHSCDRGKQGILRTIKVLDSLQIPHTGTFSDSLNRDTSNLLLIQKGDIRIGLLNYTYGTNGLAFPPPTIVNLMDTVRIVEDIQGVQNDSLDKLIVFLHWGVEYDSVPRGWQDTLSQKLFSHGADIVIGSHPHVLHKMEWAQSKNDSCAEHLVVYSMGNFVSNQRTRRTDGGAMVKITLSKKDSFTSIKDAGYYLTWVNKKEVDKKVKFEVLPASKFAMEADYFDDKETYEKMMTFITDSRWQLNQENRNIFEYVWNGKGWGLIRKGL